MNKAEKIKAEIERRYEYWKEKELNSHSIESESRMSECNHLLSMVVSLSDTEEDFGIKNVGTVWHDANNVPTKKELCLIMSDSNSGLTLNNVEVVIANPLTRRFVTCSYPHKTGKQYTVQGETPIQVDVYHSCRDYIPFSDVDKWAYISDLFNLNNSQEEPVSNDLEAEFVLYLKHKFNIPQEGNTLKTDGWKPSPYDILDIAKHFAQWQALHSLETIKEMEEQAFLAGVEAEQINKSFSKEELLNRWRNKL